MNAGTIQCYLVALYVPIFCVGITHSSVDHYNSRTRKTACLLQKNHHGPDLENSRIDEEAGSHRHSKVAWARRELDSLFCEEQLKMKMPKVTEQR
jgi:hypothetical protein